MTEFYEVEVSREAKVRQFVKVRIPKEGTVSTYTAETRAKAYITAAVAAGQPIAWATGDPTPSLYAGLEAEVVGGHVIEPAPPLPESAPQRPEPIDHLAPETVS